MGKELNVARYLGTLRPGLDVVVKRPASLPVVQAGGDIDILSIDKDELLKRLFLLASEMGYEAICRRIPDGAIQLDIYMSPPDFVRFDIRSDFRNWKRVRIRASLNDRLVSDFRRSSLGSELSFPILSQKHEALFRYLEYLNYFWVGEDKAHHLSWIEKQISREEWEEVLKLAHLYLDSGSPRRVNPLDYFFKRTVLFLSKSKAVRDFGRRILPSAK